MPARDLAQSDTALIDGFSDHLALERHLALSTVEEDPTRRRAILLDAVRALAPD